MANEQGRFFGYARVSVRSQNEDRQLRALEEVPVPRENIFVDKQSGKDFSREQYWELANRLRPNDVLFVKSIDRFGRNYREILEQWRYLTKELNVDVVVLDSPLIDTRRDKDLLGTFIADVVLQILSFVSENERAAILQRQREGIELAKAKGVRFGRPRRIAPRDFENVVGLWKEGKLPGALAAKLAKMPLSTFRDRAKSMLE